MRGASRLIATAEQEREELLAGGIPDSKIVVRRNGIDVPGSFPPPGRFRNQWDISTNVKLVLFLGRLVSKKSPDLMLEAFSRWHRQGNGHGRSRFWLWRVRMKGMVSASASKLRPRRWV